VTARQLIALLSAFPDQEAEVLIETPDGDEVIVGVRAESFGGSAAIVIETDERGWG
jgi:hypothetical protein